MLRTILTQLIRQQATQQVSEVLREKTSEAARGETPNLQDTIQAVRAAAEDVRSQVSGESESFVEEPVKAAYPPEFGFLFALGVESGGFEDLMSDTSRIQGHGNKAKLGVFGGRSAAVQLCEAGRERAALATKLLIETHKPQWIFSVGFAGGLEPQLKKNDIVMIQRVVSEDGSSVSLPLNVDPDSLDASPGVHAGTLVTVDRIVHRPEEKRKLGKQSGALAVDMETWGVAEACQSLNKKLFAVRVILDTVDERLSPGLEPLLDASSGSGLMRKAGVVTGTLMRKPSTLKDLYRLKENAIVASDRLARFLLTMVEQFPSS
jgi:adenosylhomocysteine nucleosidase